MWTNDTSGEMEAWEELSLGDEDVDISFWHWRGWPSSFRGRNCTPWRYFVAPCGSSLGGHIYPWSCRFSFLDFFPGFISRIRFKMIDHAVNEVNWEQNSKRLRESSKMCRAKFIQDLDLCAHNWTWDHFGYRLMVSSTNSIVQDDTYELPINEVRTCHWLIAERFRVIWQSEKLIKGSWETMSHNDIWLKCCKQMRRSNDAQIFGELTFSIPSQPMGSLMVWKLLLQRW